MKSYLLICPIFLIVILCFSFTDQFHGQVLIDGKLFVFDQNKQSLIEGRLSKHVLIFNNILLDSALSQKMKMLKRGSYSNDTVRVIVDSEPVRIVYYFGNKYGIRSIDFDTFDIPKLIYFNCINERLLTGEESEYFKLHKKISPSFAMITKEQSIDRGKALLGSIFGNVESQKFDSTVVDENETNYKVKFYIKIKNDILDGRSAEVTLNANSGEIERYLSYGSSYGIDFSYIPKVKKAQVLQLYADETKRLNAEIAINSIALSNWTKRELSCWAWFVYGYRKDKILNHSAMMVIDSETGKVIVNAMDR